MVMHDVVITGMGIVSSLGTSVEEFGRNMFAGWSGVTDRQGSANFPVPVGAPVQRGLLGQPQILRHLVPADTPHFWRLAGLATEQAIEFLPENVPVEALIYGGDGFIGFNTGKAS